MTFQIVILCCGRHELLMKELKGLEAQRPPELDKVFLIFNGTEVIKEVAQFALPLQVVQTQKLRPSLARNVILSQLSAQYVLFLDDDILLPPKYFTTALQLIKDHPKVDILGGPDGEYPESQAFEQSINLALTSPLCTAHTRARHKKSNRPKAGEEHFSLAHLWVRTNLFQTYGKFFDQRFLRNEESVFIDELKWFGAKMIYAPELTIHHKRKENWKSFLTNVFNSGHFRRQSLFYYPLSLNLLYFVPATFILYLVSLLLINHSVWRYPLWLYLGLVFVSSLHLCYQSGRWKLFLRMLLIQPAINLAYGLGFLSTRPRQAAT